jgi:hypothetical protein
MEQLSLIWDRLSIREHIVWRDVEGELVLFDSKSGVYHTLNNVASSIWRGVARRQPLSSLVSGLAEKYHADERLISGDIFLFVQDAGERGLLNTGSGVDE